MFLQNPFFAGKKVEFAIAKKQYNAKPKDVPDLQIFIDQYTKLTKDAIIFAQWNEIHFETVDRSLVET